VQEYSLEIMSARQALLKIGARRALKIMSAHAPKIMGARPHFSREYFMSLFF
jgi:hypothetical protein